MISTQGDNLDSAVRLAVYKHVIAHGRSPSVDELCTVVSAGPDEVDASLHRLAHAHLLVLTLGTSSVWMAMPFSTVPTRFVVDTPQRSYFANCAWDALGVPVVLEEKVTIRTSCADCGEPVDLKVEQGRLKDSTGLVHFAVPARYWWDDIGHT